MRTSKSNNTKLYILMLWMAIVPLASSAFITILLFQNELVFQSLSPLQWGLLFIITAFTMAFAITPTTYVALVSGYFIGFWGVLPLVLAYQFASVIGFFMAKYIDRGLIHEIITKYPKADRILQNVDRNQFLLTLLARLSPALPFALMNVVLSASKIRIKHFFWAGLIGMLPRSMFFIWIGIQASKLSEAFNNQENFYLSLFLTLGVIFVIFKVLKVSNKTSDT